MSRIVNAVCYLFFATLCGCSDTEPTTTKVEVNSPSPVEGTSIPDDELREQILIEMEELKLQREQAEQDKFRLENEAQDIQDALYGVDERADQLQVRINQMEDQQY
jgi:hypothetical protein